MRRALALAAVLGATPSLAAAGGLARPNLVSARGVSLGGAFVAVADDATAWHFNPAGPAFASPGVHLGGELVIAPRTYVPVDAAGNRGAEQSPDTIIAPLPALGVMARVGDRVTLGGGVWNTYGGQLSYCDDRAACDAEHATDGLSRVVDKTQNAVIELVGGLSYRVNDTLAVGASVRFGYGLFKVLGTEKPVDSDLSASGVGVATALGAVWRASDRVTVGGAWRSALVVETSGDGQLLLPGGPLDVTVEHTQQWPQAAAIGVAVAATPTVRWSAQLDWTQWSRFERLDVSFPGNEAANQSFPLDWTDSYGVRSGVEWRQSARLALRGGAWFDSNAIPDYTIERQYMDRNKWGLSYGAGLGFGAWHVDVGGDLAGVFGGAPRTVPDNSAEVGDFRSQANAAPGEYSSKLITFELAVVRRL